MYSVLNMIDDQRSDQEYTKCGLMQQELQEIWDEVGESEHERDLMLVEIEKQCLGVYRRKLDEANKCKAHMQQEITTIRAEISKISSVLGELSRHVTRKIIGGLKSELEAIIPQLEAMKKRKSDRKGQLIEALDQLVKISNDIGRSVEDDLYDMIENETDLSLKLLERLRAKMLDCLSEKRDRQRQVEDQLSNLKSLCLVLGMDFTHIIGEINPMLNDSNDVNDISKSTINGLSEVVLRLSEVKMKRWDKLQNFAASLIEFWNLMDIPMAEQKAFHVLTSKIAASVSEVTKSNMLSSDFVNHVETEVKRLEYLRSSKLNDLVEKKRSELEDICRRAHMVTKAHGAVEHTNSEALDPECLLAQIELQIARAKEETLSRKELLDKAEKWLTSCQEESWLEEYNKDDKRFHAGRGAHLALKRAEKARILINKIPAMLEPLISRTTAWEVERGVEFLYDGVRLLNMLEQYKMLRQEKENERRLRKEQRKLQGQLIAEKEVLYGTKPSPLSGKKSTKISANRLLTNSKLSNGRAMLQKRKLEKTYESLSQKSSVRHEQCGCFVPLSPSEESKSNQVHGSSGAKTFLSPKLSPEANDENKTPQNKNIMTPREVSCSPGDWCSTSTPTSTPFQVIMVDCNEIETPKTMPIPLPNTPSTPCCKSGQPIEYSFEEVRAGFLNPLLRWD